MYDTNITNRVFAFNWKLEQLREKITLGFSINLQSWLPDFFDKCKTLLKRFFEQFNIKSGLNHYNIQQPIYINALFYQNFTLPKNLTEIRGISPILKE